MSLEPDIPGADRASPRLSPWPWRLLVFAILVVLAVASICVIDRHAMARSSTLQEPTSSTR